MATALSLKAPHTAELETQDFPCENLSLRRVDGTEGMNKLYSYRVLMAWTGPTQGLALSGPLSGTVEPPVDPSAMIGATVALRFFDREAKEIVRSVFGMVSRVETRLDPDSTLYDLEIVPHAHKLSLFKTQDIFMNKSVPQIIEEKLSRAGLTLNNHVLFRTSSNYAPRDFVVQFGETDLAFICRLAEHVGLSFFFEHDDSNGGAHETMVFTDHAGGFQSFGDQSISYAPRGDKASVSELTMSHAMIPARYFVMDYNYQQPLTEILAERELSREEVPERRAGGVIEYGTHYATEEEGQVFANIRAEESLLKRRFYKGKGMVGGFTVGAHFNLENHPIESDSELLLTEVTHHLEQSAGEASSTQNSYGNTFTVVPSRLRYRPPRETPVPRINGILTGMIHLADGDPGRQAEIDDQGRYTVRFHFDTVDSGTLPASVPVRMAQPYAGANEGMHLPLRPGTEVAVAFVGGDPDRPLIVGAIPNPVTPSVVTAADSHKYRIRSRYGLTLEFGRAK